MASAAADVAAVRDAKDLPGLAPLDHELRREIARRTPPASPPSGRVREANPYSFGRLQAWDYPRLNPPPSEAFKLLQRCVGWGKEGRDQTGPRGLGVRRYV